jgi:hypothetical protein
MGWRYVRYGQLDLTVKLRLSCRATAQLLTKEGVRIASFKNELKSQRNILRNYFQ